MYRIVARYRIDGKMLRWATLYRVAASENEELELSIRKKVSRFVYGFEGHGREIKREYLSMKVFSQFLNESAIPSDYKFESSTSMTTPDSCFAPN